MGFCAEVAPRSSICLPGTVVHYYPLSKADSSQLGWYQSNDNVFLKPRLRGNIMGKAVFSLPLVKL